MKMLFVTSIVVPVSLIIYRLFSSSRDTKLFAFPERKFKKYFRLDPWIIISKRKTFLCQNKSSLSLKAAHCLLFKLILFKPKGLLRDFFMRSASNKVKSLNWHPVQFVLGKCQILGVFPNPLNTSTWIK